MSRTRVMLIRHGQTSWSVEKRYFGSTDIGLDEEGKRQSLAVKKAVAGLKIEQVYSSDLSRAYDFASLIFGGRDIKKDKRLREIDFGDFEGLTHDELMDKHGDIYKAWIDNPFKKDLPNGESIADLRARMTEVLGDMVDRHGGETVCLVTHAGPIKWIIHDIMKLSSIWEFSPRLASITTIEYGDGNWRAILLDDTLHLK